MVKHDDIKVNMDKLNEKLFLIVVIFIHLMMCINYNEKLRIIL